MPDEPTFEVPLENVLNAVGPTPEPNWTLPVKRLLEFRGQIKSVMAEAEDGIMVMALLEDLIQEAVAFRWKGNDEYE